MEQAAKQINLSMKVGLSILLTILVLQLSALEARAAPKTVLRYPAEQYDMEVKFDLAKHSLSGAVSITFAGKSKKKVGFILNNNFKVIKASIEDTDLALIRMEDYKPEKLFPNYGRSGKLDLDKFSLWIAEIPKQFRKTNRLVLVIGWEGSIYSEPDDRQFSRESIALEVNGTIGEEGIFLSPAAYWYPFVPESPATYRLKAHLPLGWNGVTAGSPQWHDEDGYTVVEHISEQPLAGLNFSAGQYIIKSLDHNGVQIMTYMLPAEASLADGYIESCIGYIDRYSEQIAPYPFPKFAVVDNFLPSGYGMPGWTLLGSEVIRLPFIRFTSLGHEVLHNWFGNSMWVDYLGGNWCEGLTTYLADYAYKAERDSLEGVEYRANALRDIDSYVDPDGDYPIAEFTARQNSRDRAIGYSKVMMVFHMLRELMETKSPMLFDEIISDVYFENQWSSISWKGWQAAFEKKFGQRLEWLFGKNVRSTGVPEIYLRNMRYNQHKTGWQAKFDVYTDPKEQLFSYLLPIREIFVDGRVKDVFVYVQTPRQGVNIAGEGVLSEIQIDPGFDLLRKPHPGELPITLAAFFGDKDGILVVPSGGQHATAYKKAAEGLKTEGQQVILDVDITDELKLRSLWIFGRNNKLWSSFPQPEMEISADDSRKISLTVVVKHPSWEGSFIVRTVCTDDADPVAGTRKLSHYGKYSFLKFDGDRNIDKGVIQPTGENPLKWEAEK